MDKTDKIFEESGFIFDFTACENVYVADKPSYKGLKAVDFIIETADEYLFIEIKNPDNEKARPHNRREFIERFRLPDTSLEMAVKFKDSLLRELAAGKKFDKPIVYILILECKDFDAAQRRKLYEHINSHIPNFKEDNYKIIKNIKFFLYTKDEFLKFYNIFKINIILH